MNLDASKNLLDKDKKERATGEGHIKNLLFKGVLWYKLSNDLTWEQVGQQTAEKGLNYNSGGFIKIATNWGATQIGYFYKLYAVLGIPLPTPELLLYWDTEIKRMEAERAEARRVKREKVQAGKQREAERIAAGGTPRKHNDRRK